MNKLVLVIFILALGATSASATVLWDQSDYDSVDQYGSWDSVSGCAPFGGSIHYASDITIYDQVTVETITTYYNAFNNSSATEAWLYIAPKTGPLPVNGVDLPQENGVLVPVTMTNVGGINHLVADGLNVMLNPGEYWVSLTPIISAGFQGPDFHLRSMSPMGNTSAYYEYCGQFAPAWAPQFDSFDLSILIEGTINAVPNESDTVGQLKARF